MKVIALVGIDGSGKSTLAGKLADHFNQRGIPASVLNVRNILTSTTRIQRHKSLLGVCALLGCMLYPIAKWRKRKEGIHILIVERCPPIELDVYATMYGAWARYVARVLSLFYERPDAIIHITIDVALASANIEQRGIPRQWHEYPDTLRRINMLLLKKTKALRAIRTTFPVSADEVYSKIEKEFAI